MAVKQQDIENQHTKPIRICPICGGASVKELHQIEYTMPEHSIRPQAVSIVCCDMCGFVYKDVDTTDSEIESKENRYESFEQDYTKAFLDIEARVISAHMQPEFSVLDIGCSTGYLLEQLKALGFSDLQGLEPSTVSCEKVRNRGIPVTNGSIYDDIEDFTNKFNLIILSQVLEHIVDIDRCMNNLKKWLRKDGKVFVSVPCEDMCDQYYGSISSLLCSEHVNHFGKKSLDRLFMTYGFEDVYHEARPYYGDMNTNHHDDCTMASFDSIYRISNEPLLTRQLEKDCETEKHIKNLLRQYNQRKKESIDKIAELEGQGIQLVIWGVSHMAMNRLCSDLKELDIVAFTDRDSSKIGQVIKGIPVIPVSSLPAAKVEIVVMDNQSKYSICTSIRQAGLNLPIHIL